MIRAAAMTEYVFFVEKRNSSTELEMDSKPINAHGAKLITRNTWEMGILSVAKRGSKLSGPPSWIPATAEKHAKTPSSSSVANNTCSLTARRFPLTQINPTRSRAATENIASPQYTS